MVERRSVFRQSNGTECGGATLGFGNVRLGMSLRDVLRLRPRAEEFTLYREGPEPTREQLAKRPNILLIEKVSHPLYEGALYQFRSAKLLEITLFGRATPASSSEFKRTALADVLQRFGRPDALGVSSIASVIEPSAPNAPCLLWTRPDATMCARFDFGIEPEQLEVSIIGESLEAARRKLPRFVAPTSEDETQRLAPFRALLEELQPGASASLQPIAPSPTPTPTVPPPGPARIEQHDFSPAWGAGGTLYFHTMRRLTGEPTPRPPQTFEEASAIIDSPRYKLARVERDGTLSGLLRVSELQWSFSAPSPRGTLVAVAPWSQVWLLDERRGTIVRTHPRDTRRSMPAWIAPARC
jgi:hypothetical protein